MRAAVSLVLSLSLAFPVVNSLQLVKKDVPSVIGLDIQRRDVADPIQRDRVRKRSKTVSEVLDNEESLYFANITLGTPTQNLRVHIDTGSSDLWVNTPDSAQCKSKGEVCAQSGTYSANKSSTYQYVSSNFNISYVDGSGASGDYVKDTIGIGGQTLQSFQFAVGYKSTSEQGVLGIGYRSNEALVAINGDSPYANLPQAMVDASVIQSNAYSLWLNDLDASTGSILFGGINTGKYNGKLETIPIAQEGGEFREFIIALTGVAFNNSGSSQSISSSSLPAAVLLDSGSSLTYLPDAVAAALYRQVDATYDAGSGAAYVPCSMANDASSVGFTFSSPVIHVPMNELVLDEGSDLTFNDGTPACLFGIAPAGSDTAVLGDTFLRSAYVVYDLANNEISLANTNFNSTEDNVLEIGTGSNSVPDATGVSNPVTAITATGGARNGGVTNTAGVVTTASTAGVFPTAVPKNLAMAGIAGAGLLLGL